MRRHWFALLAILLVFAACKGDSPTAPPPTTTGGPTTPPTGVTINVTTSSTDVEVDQNVVITASVTANGNAVPNGTAVEFSTTNGTFADTGQRTTVRITNNGTATATLSSATATTAIVTVTVNNVSRSTPTITFRARPVTQPQPSTDPTISSVAPTSGRPSGGERITIAGTNFRGRVRVFFQIPGEATEREVTVESVSPDGTRIIAITPAVQLAPGGTLDATIRVVVDADTANARSVAAPTPFTYRLVQITPDITTITPNSGPLAGGTQVTIFGTGFQEPVQVLFGVAEAQIIQTNFDQISVVTPPARDTTGDGSEPVTGLVDVTVININSGTRDTITGGFRYSPGMAITGISPLFGSALGGTEIAINGIGFDGRLQVTVGTGAGERELQVIRISGTQILARTSALSSPCSGFSGPINVRNLDNGLVTASTPQVFSFVPVLPQILSVAPSDTTVNSLIQPGETVNVRVQNPGVGPFGTANIRFTVNGQTITPSPSSITAGTGNADFVVAVPSSGFTFPTLACTIGGLAGTQFGPLDVDFVFNNTTTVCTDTLRTQVHPPGANPCLTPPTPSVTVPAGGTCANPANASVAGAPAQTQAPITIANAAGSQPLNITGVAISGANAAEFSIAPTTASNIAAGGSQNFVLTFDPTTAGAKAATVTFTTNSTTTPTLTVCVQATAVP